MESFNIIIDRAKEALGVIVIHHGFAEHSGRYQHETDYFLEHGFHVVRFDIREHGAHNQKIDSYESFIDDLGKVMDKVHLEFSDFPIFLWGHSMGGLMSTIFAQRFPEKLKGLILTSPAIGQLPEVEGFSKYLLKVAALVVPNAHLKNPVKNPVVVDGELLEQYAGDHVLLKSARFGLLYQFLVKAQHEINYHLGVPLLLLQGESDMIVPISCGGDYFNAVDQVDKKRIVYKQMGHELTNEPTYKEVLAVMVHWMEKEVI